jgi:hypothetical protein
MVVAAKVVDGILQGRGYCFTGKSPDHLNRWRLIAVLQFTVRWIR